jgi:hypothetical protein
VKPNEVVKWDDYTYKFNSTGQMAQVFQGDKIVGSILMMNGSLQMIPLPGTDSEKLTKSFEDWKTFNARSHGASSSATAGSGNASASGGTSGEPPCPNDFLPHYLAGSEWNPMTTAVSAGRESGGSFKEALKNPANPNAGYTRIAMYKDAAASITLGTTPKFCIALPSNVNPEVLEIGSLTVKKDHRELEITHSDKTWMPPKRVQAINVKRISDTAVEITLKEPLAPGQYVLGGPPTIGIYDFGVEANAGN